MWAARVGRRSRSTIRARAASRPTRRRSATTSRSCAAITRSALGASARVLEVLLPVARALGRHLDLHRPVDRARPRRLAAWAASAGSNTAARRILPMDQWYMGLYAQDTWRASPRVTINAGLRWEPYFGQNVTSGAVYNFSRENFRNNVRSQTFVNAPAGSHLSRRSRVPAGPARAQHAVAELLAARRARLGRDRRRPHRGARVVRAHLRLPERGISADQRELAAVRQPLDRRRPARWLRSAPTRTSAAIRTRFSTNRDTQFLPYGAFGATDPNINSPRIQQWNVTIERQLGSGLAGGGELHRQLHRSAVGPGGDQSRRLPRDSVRARSQGVFYADLHATTRT